MNKTFQAGVHAWMLVCFGQEIADDTIERNHRFFEEATELVQASGMTASEAHQLVDYVFGRPVGEIRQEVGGVMVTLAALCLAQKVNMHLCGETELDRIWRNIPQIRAKQAAKPQHSPLPQTVEVSSAPQISREALYEFIEKVCLNKSDLTALAQCAYYAFNQDLLKGQK